MTTAHRATWYTARGHEEQGGARVFAPSKMRSKLDAPGMLTMKTRWKTKEEEEMESLMNNNKDEKMTVSVGNNVLYGKYAGTELKYEGRDYLIMRESDILAIV